MDGLAVLEEKCVEVSGLLKIVANPDRLRILCALSMREMSVSELEQAINISQSSTSQFLNRMKLEGVLDSRKESTRAVYFIKDLRVLRLVQALHSIFCKDESEDK